MVTKKKIIEIGLIIIIMIVAISVYKEVSRTVDLKNKNLNNKPQEPFFSTPNKKTINTDPTPSAEKQKALEDPELQWESLSGDLVAFSDFKGTPLVINFWASWCPPCLAEMPLLQDYAKKLVDMVAILAINAGEDEVTVRNFVKEHDLMLTVLLDPDNSATKHYRVYGFPTTLFLDEDGNIQSIHIGELDEELLKKHLVKIGIEE